LNGQPRFHLLETVRELARERAEAAGELRAARVRHAEWLEKLIADAHGEILRAGRRQAARDRLLPEMAGARSLLRSAAAPGGDVELAWRLYIRLSFVLLNNAQTAEALAMHEIVAGLPRSRDPLRAALAEGMWGRGRTYMWDEAAEPLLASSARALEAAGDREFLPSVLTVHAMVLVQRDPARSVALLGRAIELAVAEGALTVESGARGALLYRFVHDAVDPLEVVP